MLCNCVIYYYSLNLISENSSISSFFFTCNVTVNIWTMVAFLMKRTCLTDYQFIVKYIFFPFIANSVLDMREVLGQNPHKVNYPTWQIDGELLMIWSGSLIYRPVEFPTNTLPLKLAWSPIHSIYKIKDN